MTNTVLVNPGGRIRQAQVTTVGIGALGIFIIVPANKRWRLLGFTADVTNTATVGNRVLQMRVLDRGVYPIWIGTASGNVTAGQVGGYDVAFGAVGAPSTAVRRNAANTGNTNVQVRDNCSVTELKATDQINFYDSAAVDAADAVQYNLFYVEYDV